jgi:hypothetical protein
MSLTPAASPAFFQWADYVDESKVGLLWGLMDERTTRAFRNLAWNCLGGMLLSWLAVLLFWLERNSLHMIEPT